VLAVADSVGHCYVTRKEADQELGRVQINITISEVSIPNLCLLFAGYDENMLI
jgi:hypothetical protein